MATRDGRSAPAAARSTNPKPPVNRVKEHEDRTGGAEAGAGEDLIAQAANLLRKREKQRQIKLHERTPDEFEPAKKSEAVALTTTDDTPDMRFVENKMKYQPDPGMRTDGKTKDKRFLENRPDLLKIALSRPDGKAGVVFADDDEGEGSE
jgi:hypothetical protein